MKFPAFQVSNALAPAKGPLAVPITVQLGVAGTPKLVQLTQDQMADAFDFVQSAWIDNSQNPQILLIVTGAPVAQVLRIPSFWQGTVPIISGIPFEANFSSVQADISIPVILLNVPMPLYGWAAV